MIAATSWFLVTLAGLGLPLAAALGGADARQQWRSGNDTASLAALALMFGLLTDHAVGLITGSLDFQAALAWVGALAAIGSLVVLARVGGGVKALVTLALVGLLAIVVYATPLLEWDARSIWFFHAKVIFFDGGLKDSPFWRNPAYDWSHWDYPELVPMLAARTAAFIGVWNEFAPKGGLIPLAVAGFTGLLAAGTRQGFIMLAPAAAAVMGATLWNGYMDGWIALYAAVAVLSLGAWMESGSRTHLALCAAALGTTLCVKNEGQLVAASLLPAILWAAAVRRKTLRRQDLSVLMALLPFALWLLFKMRLALVGDLEGADLLHRAWEAAGNGGEFRTRIAYLAQDALARTHFFAAGAAWIAIGLCVGFRRPGLVCGLVAALYAGGLGMVYLGTKQDFVWYVATSLHRVLLTPTLLFLCGLSTMIPDILSACRKAVSTPVP